MKKKGHNNYHSASGFEATKDNSRLENMLDRWTPDDWFPYKLTLILLLVASLLGLFLILGKYNIRRHLIPVLISKMEAVVSKNTFRPSKNEERTPANYDIEMVLDPLLNKSKMPEKKNKIMTTEAKLEKKEEKPRIEKVELKKSRKKRVARGGKLLKQQEKGEFPVLVMKYDQIGVEKYLESIAPDYGRIFIFSVKEKRLVAEYDSYKDTLKPVFKKSLMFNDLAVDRPREITEGVDSLIEKAKQRYGKGDYRVILLLKSDVDKIIAADVELALKEQKVSNGEVAQVTGKYIIKGSKLAIQLEIAWLKNRYTRRLNRTVFLEG